MTENFPNFFTCIHLYGMMRGSVFRWILLPRLFRRCPRQPPERCDDWSDQVPAGDHLALHPNYWSSIRLLFSTTTKMQTLSVSLHRHPINFLLSAPVIPIALSALRTDSASHFHSKEPDLPSILLTVLHQLLILQVLPLIRLVFADQMTNIGPLVRNCYF